MNVLILSARRPARHGRGDQKRAWCLARELSEHHAVRVVCFGLSDDEPTPDSVLAGVQMIELAAPPWRRGFAAVTGVLRGLPLQAGWTRAPAGDARLEEALAWASVVYAVTVRVVDRELPVPVLLDHVDALSLNMQRRATIDPSRVRRLGARAEATLLRRHERRTARWVAAQLVTTRADADVLPALPAPTLLPPHMEAPAGPQPAADAPRPVDVILTGNMHYPPNRQAYAVLANEVLPLLLAARPTTTVRVVGRRADTLERHAGISIGSDVPDMQVELAQARVAVAPVTGGTGAPQKLLEAGAAGAAVVAPAWTLEAFGIELAGAETPKEMAAQVLTLLEDEPLRRRNVAEVVSAAARSTPERLAAQVEPLLQAAVRR